uniref:hypothetical protein n=1 Tax=Aliarcobacter sp. TaxID=2321116 RepID=UPI004048100B
MIDTTKAKEVLDDITFQVLQLEKVSNEIKSIENLKDIRAHLEGLRTVKINTSEVEKQFEEEVRKIRTSIQDIVSSVDLNEIDEISVLLREMKKSVRPFRIFNIMVICILSLSVGYMSSIFYPLSIMDKQKIIIDDFKKQGVKISQNNEYKYIVFPSGMERQTKNGQTAYLIKK